ncbi:MAG: biosynthetic-type acetolactate synthase large subunit [Candidatus Anammoxibacter sp.]
MERTGSQIFIDTLINEGVEYVFGIPGGVLIPLFDALYESQQLKFILTRHEQGAGHAADGFARATGKVGVCLATSGPGATNLTTAIATAFMDSIPMVAFTGQVKTHLIGNDAFQEADTIGITRPITKHSFLVRDVKDLEQTIKEAFYIANSGRKGPIVIDLPGDITTNKCESGNMPEEIELPGYKPSYHGNIKQITQAAELINQSEKPVIYAGGGVISAEASQQLTELARKTNIPVTTTLMGLGAFPETDKLSLGMLGMHGTAYANYTITHSDCIIAVGARFDDRITGRIDEFAPNAEIIHIDVDPTSISKSIKVHIPVVGDAKVILEELNKYVKFDERKDWLKKVFGWKEKHPLVYENSGDKIKPQYVIEQICKIAGEDAIITTDVGQHQMWSSQYYTFTKPRTFLTSGGLGTMGYGFPAAIGAKFGFPDRNVICISGDGSFQMNMQELSTAVNHNVQVKVAILDNGFLGMVRQWQDLFFGKRYSNTRLNGNPDFVKIAEAYGVAGFLVEKKEDVASVLEKALKIDGPVVMDFKTEPEENVFPMVPAGEAIHRMIDGMA